jgi:hypothetical protein
MSLWVLDTEKNGKIIKKSRMFEHGRKQEIVFYTA